jgi:hypothetical protein
MAHAFPMQALPREGLTRIELAAGRNVGVAENPDRRDPPPGSYILGQGRNAVDLRVRERGQATWMAGIGDLDPD